jgi:hypothetical protein
MVCPGAKIFVVISLLQKKKPPVFRGPSSAWGGGSLAGHVVQTEEGPDIWAIAMDMDIATERMRGRP